MNPFMGAYGAAEPSPGRASFEQLSRSHAQIEVEPGALWYVKKDGEDWPVVICDEEIVRKFFKGKPRPDNARRSDGTWAKESIGHECYPAVIPGNLKTCWLSSESLEVSDTGMGEAIRESTDNPLLAKACCEAIQYLESKKGTKYWKDRLSAKERARLRAAENPGGLYEGKQSESRKRKGTPRFKFPPGYAREEADDDEGGDIFLSLAEDKNGPKIKNEFSDSTPLTGIEPLHEEPDRLYPRRAESSKRNKLDLAGRFSLHSQEPVREGGRSRPGTPLIPGLGPWRASVATSNPQPTPLKSTTDVDKVMIYVGNPHKMFRARRSGLEASPLLSSQAAYHPQNGWYLMSPLLSSLDVNDFFPIGQYLERGEYNPNILDEGTEWVRLEDNLTDDQRGQEVVRCGTIYSIAQQLELLGLQDLAFRKLKALAKQEPYYPFAILCVTDAVFECGSENLREYLVQYLATHYWDIMLAQTQRFAEVMKADDELSQGVFRLLSGVAPVKWTDAKVEGEQVVKEEKKGNSADEDDESNSHMPTSSAMTHQSVGTNESETEPQVEERVGSRPKSPTDLGLGVKADTFFESIRDTGLDIKAEPGLDMADEEMIRMALRESDKEATEEQITQMIREQSRIFKAF